MFNVLILITIIILLFIITIICQNTTIVSVISSDYTYKIENKGKFFNDYWAEIKILVLLQYDMENTISNNSKIFTIKKHYRLIKPTEEKIKKYVKKYINNVKNK